MRKFIIGISLALFLMPASLWANEALVGNYTLDSFDNLRVVVKDNATVRINIIDDGQEDVFMLLNDGKRWMVGRDDSESGWEAFDFDALAVLMQAKKNQMPDIIANAKITKGEAQTVAGIAGEIFSVEYPDENVIMMVLTENAEVATLTKAICAFLVDIVDIDEDELVILADTLERISKDNGKDYGVLQYDGIYEFVSIEHKSYSDNYFNLPGNVTILSIDELFGEE